jgi:hypothetical protein
MSQLLYWWQKGSKKDWVYKTIDEAKEETCLTRSEQDTAIRIWKKLGVLEVKLMGVPCKRHFRINKEKFFSLIKTTSGKDLLSKSPNKFDESDKLNCSNRHTNTESTHESTNKETLKQSARFFRTEKVEGDEREEFPF